MENLKFSITLASKKIAVVMLICCFEDILLLFLVFQMILVVIKAYWILDLALSNFVNHQMFREGMKGCFKINEALLNF